MKLVCPHGHAAVIRNDPESMGLIGQCDTCGWTASYMVAREEAIYRETENHQLREAQKDEAGRRAIGTGETKRRGD